MTVADFSPDALDQLEAQLLADLETVRRIRALLQEHRPRLAAPVSPLPPALGTALFIPASPPQKSDTETIHEALLSLTTPTFRTQALRMALDKQHWRMDSREMRALISQLLRKGTVAVVTTGKGREGSLYRHTLSKPPPSELESSINSEVPSIILTDPSNIPADESIKPTE